MTIYRCEYAWLPDGIERDVAIQVENGYITAVSPASSGGIARAGLTIPGFANAHSHAFHRALRGRTHNGGGDFWTWREQMYRVAAKLDPDSYYRLARAVYGEMALAGVTTVGEFHYLHHAPGGARYSDPNAMGHAVIQAAHDAGIRITLIDTLYLQAGVNGEPLSETQLRFSDGDADAWAERVAGIVGTRIGAAIHSVRAVPPSQMRPVAEFDGPIHAHVSEQGAENEACQALHHCSPVELLAERGVLQQGFTAVHATHLSESDIAQLSQAYTCFCPTTERDLGDGIGPARALHEAGAQLTLGSDSHAVIDLFEESRGLELNERLASQKRGRFSPDELLFAATKAGHDSLGWTDAGRIAVGQRADLVTVSLDSPRTAGSDPAGILFTATAADVTHVVVDGREVVADGRHVSLDVAGELREAVCALY
ncbi:formimidoylglutamate deiminase [Allorhizocola rhizosphaerae]|uniref:formimidoylglutamate deiminase n=1 Tax=Allorhizocola rhizosphaerae TaxID=1872709 RepID=UPI000E3CABD0|nr:formimidoylglutamate deiminase [Allorhizocola rhizosphaerae]